LAALRTGSLSGAARALKLTQPTIGRHIDELEKALGTVLFTRSPHGLLPTDAAVELGPHAEAMAASVAALMRAASGASQEIGGTVRLSASEVVGVEVLPPMLASLREQHPRLTLQLVVSNEVRDLLRRDVDLAVRNVCPTQSGLLARKIGDVTLGLYAPQRQRTAAVITRDTNTAPEPRLVAEEVLRAIERPYRMRRPVGQAVLLSWLRRLLPARLFGSSLRKAFVLDPLSKAATVTQPRTRA
jgi:DNA-binding transcriptional LysR family regulator